MYDLAKLLFCVCLLTLSAISRANPLKQVGTFDIEDNEIQREKRQMKGDTATTEQAEVKLLSAAQILAGTDNSALQSVNGATNNNLQTARFSPYGNALMMSGGYANMAGLGYGVNVGLGGIHRGQPIHQAGASGFENFPAYLYGGGFYPNTGAPLLPHLGAGGIPPLNPLDRYGNLQGVSTQLIAQPSHLPPQQITPYAVMPGFYPQMGYSPAFQNFQG